MNVPCCLSSRAIHTPRRHGRLYVSIKFVNDMVRLRRETGSLAPKRQGNPERDKLTGVTEWVQRRIGVTPYLTDHPRLLGLRSIPNPASPPISSHAPAGSGICDGDVPLPTRNVIACPSNVSSYKATRPKLFCPPTLNTGPKFPSNALKLPEPTVKFPLSRSRSNSAPKSKPVVLRNMACVKNVGVATVVPNRVKSGNSSQRPDQLLARPMPAMSTCLSKDRSTISSCVSRKVWNRLMVGPTSISSKSTDPETNCPKSARMPSGGSTPAYVSNPSISAFRARKSAVPSSVMSSSPAFVWPSSANKGTLASTRASSTNRPLPASLESTTVSFLVFGSFGSPGAPVSLLTLVLNSNFRVTRSASSDVGTSPIGVDSFTASGRNPSR